MPATQAARSTSHTASSFFAVGARLAGEPGEPGDAVYQLHRVIVLRGQASLLQANRATRSTSYTASSFFAGKPRSYRQSGSLRIRPYKEI